MLRQRLMARCDVRLLASALILGCAQSRVPEFHEIGRFHAPNMHTLYPDVTHFVVAPRSVLADRKAVLDYSRRACAEDVQVCLVLYWTDPTKAAVSFPIRPNEAQAMMASYHRNRSTGRDGLQCYNFGSAAERCESTR
jgi:hypothetical protein